MTVRGLWPISEGREACSTADPKSSRAARIADVRSAVGRTPWSASDPLVALGFGRGLPHYGAVLWPASAFSAACQHVLQGTVETRHS
jgi:hypothetical protein